MKTNLTEIMKTIQLSLAELKSALASVGYVGLLDIEQMTGTPTNSTKSSIEWFKKKGIIEKGPKLKRVGANGQTYHYQSYALRRINP